MKVTLLLCDPAVVTAASPLESHLSEAERARAARFYFEEDWRAYVAGHAGLRLALGRRTAIAPPLLSFRSGEHGKPALEPSPAEPLEFNLTHTRGLAAVAIAPATVGVDAEQLQPEKASLDVARRFFAAPELDALLALDGAARTQRFFELWTLKEAYLKARGAGLSLPLRSAVFDPSDRAGITVSFGPELNDDPHRWSFALLSFGPKLLIALCARADEQPLVVETLELRADGTFSPSFRGGSSDACPSRPP